MTIVDIITALCCRVDEAMTDVPPHSQQALAPSELATIGLLYALKGGSRYFYRWLRANCRACSPRSPVAPGSSAACAHIKTGRTVSWWRPARWGA